MSKRNLHNKTLEDIVKSPSLIGEDVNKLVSILREPIWYNINSQDYQKMCDIILIYDNYGIPVEVKGSDRYREKAIIQVYQGKKYIENIIGLPVPNGKIAYYGLHNKSFRLSDLLWEKI